MFWIDAINGEQAILPAKVRGEGLNTYDSSQTTESDVGTVVKTGTGTVTIGYFVGPSESATFVAYDEGLMAGNDVLVNHGQGVRLARWQV
jgi:hypothetical protein